MKVREWLVMVNTHNTDPVPAVNVCNQHRRCVNDCRAGPDRSVTGRMCSRCRLPWDRLGSGAFSCKKSVEYLAVFSDTVIPSQGMARVDGECAVGIFVVAVCAERV